jgi:hypothetical protein
MTETEIATPPKSAAEILLDAAKQADREHRKEINRAVKEFFDDPKFKNVPEDFLAVAKETMQAKAVFDPKSHLLTVGKKKMRNPSEWIEKKFPTLLKQAELPRGDVELQAAQTACTSLSMQAELVKSLGVQKTGELMALYGGAVGRISKPLPLADKKAKDKDWIADRDNPWGQAWNLTRQGQYIREHGEAKGAELAARVGSKIGATKPTKVRA